MKKNANFGTNVVIDARREHCPLKMHVFDAAYDTFTAKEVEVTPNSRCFIPLGFKIGLPTNMGLIVQPRSGQSGRGMIAFAVSPRWFGAERYKIRINADVLIGLVDSGYSEEVNAIVKVGRLSFKHRLLRLLGFKIVIPCMSRVAQCRFVYIPQIKLSEGMVKGYRSGLGSTDK